MPNSLKSLRVRINGTQYFEISFQNVEAVPEHIQIDLTDCDYSGDQDSTEELMIEQSDSEPVTEQGSEKRNGQENVGWIESIFRVRWRTMTTKQRTMSIRS